MFWDLNIKVLAKAGVEGGGGEGEERENKRGGGDKTELSLIPKT